MQFLIRLTHYCKPFLIVNQRISELLRKVPASCPQAARGVPARCLPAICFLQKNRQNKITFVLNRFLLDFFTNSIVFSTEFTCFFTKIIAPLGGTLPALCGHLAGTLRAPCGHLAGTKIKS